MRNFIAFLLSHHSLDLVEKISSLFFVSHRRRQIITVCVIKYYLIRASLPRSKRLIFSTRATYIFPCGHLPSDGTDTRHKRKSPKAATIRLRT